MKNTGFSILLIWFAVFALAPNTFAQDSSQWHLPEGAKARLGKGLIKAIQYSPDGTRLAVASSIGIWLYDARSGEELDLLTGHRASVTSVSFSPDGTTIATGSWDKTVRLWDANTGRHIRTLTGHTGMVTSVSFSPDGTTIASGGRDATVRLWDANTGREIRTLTGHTFYVLSVSFSPDGTTIASGGFGEIRLWDANTGREIRTLTGHTDMVYSVSFSPDGTTIASGSTDATVRLWDANTGRHIRTLTGHTGMVTSVSFSPDGTTIASGSRDKTVRLWDGNTGRHIRTLAGHTWVVWSVSFSPDGTTIATGSWDHTVGLWDANTGRHIRTLTGHTGRLWSVSFSPDGTTIASGSEDGTVLLWELAPTPMETDSIAKVPDVPVGEDVVTVSLLPSMPPAAIGDRLTLSVAIASGVDVAGYQVSVDFDGSALRYVSSADAEYLPVGAFVVPSLVSGNQVTLAATALQGSSEGDGVLATLTFEVIAANPSLPRLSAAKLTDSNADFLAVRIENSSVSEPVSLAGDVNGDGVLSVEDLSWAATRLGQRGENTADMNGDGVVDAADLLLIATAIDQGNAAPSLHSDSVAEMFTAAEVRRWLWLARQQGLTDPMYQRGFLLLEQLLVILTPKETALLSNYPNPFNPETWIPYHLSEPAEVRIAIYAADGRLVRTLGLEHQAAGIYESRSRAAYWDGRNALGEPVASGVYFYTLTAGDFAATRKMLIRK